MFSRRQAHSHHRLLLALSLAAGLALCSGCANLDLAGPGFDDETAGWAKNLRPPVQGDAPFSATTKARQIEQNLGYQ